ncbi:Beta-1,4-mannosyl-glycoprotein 4-beta-N-acetylglucosaminyltransferase [Perkinsus olseni]|uniref:Beta-1,4-mannosyl-glycoprotein 4-beta-N-acetylglucosaminyltransferase n=1 Tax=Perkinsus olseni TaxID=32597 RepID=A0A7J6P0F0_PEROL|nr:Beta-1,4-mannosyl-glycoprotein 4-beta-N-acetylglucosaminyltransferase [Perkinsus olseni]
MQDPPELKPMVFERPPERQLRWDCEGNPYMSGNRTTPKRIVDLLLFAYEFDILELRLYELDPVVDVFVILETTRALKKWEKPLMLGSVINSPRFRRFRHKIMYSVFDDSTHGRYQGFKSRKEGKYDYEDFARASLVEKYFQVYGHHDDDVLFIHGDVDEMPSAEQLAGVKYCEPLDDRFPVTLPSLFLAQNFAWKRSDMNVLNSPHVFDAAAMRRNDVTGLLQPVRYPGAWILDFPTVGAHMSSFMSSEADILKFLAYSDAGKLPRSDFDKATAAALARYPHMGTVWKVCAVRVSDPSDELLTKRIDYDTWIPWFADVNRHRYPYFFPSSQTLEMCGYVRHHEHRERKAFDRALAWVYSKGLQPKCIGSGMSVASRGAPPGDGDGMLRKLL